VTLEQPVTGFQVASVHSIAVFVLDTPLLPPSTRSLRLAFYRNNGQFCNIANICLLIGAYRSSSHSSSSAKAGESLGEVMLRDASLPNHLLNALVEVQLRWRPFG
jgi:hypothetical protein